jgi:heme/copper-type cytochrome/quinol oxidase subunit 3
MNKYLTPFLITVLLAIILIVVFALIYHNIDEEVEEFKDKKWINSFYDAVTIQTLIGMGDGFKGRSDSAKIWGMVQSFIAYLITLGLIFVLYKYFTYPNGSNGSKGSNKIMSPI